MEICIKWNMCRACMRQNNPSLEPLFKDAQIVKHLEQYAGVVVEPNDSLPDKICTDCIEKLFVVHKFISTCQESDEHLKNVVNRTMSTKTSFTSPVMVKREKRKQILTGRSIASQLKRFRLRPVDMESFQKDENTNNGSDSAPKDLEETSIAQIETGDTKSIIQIEMDNEHTSKEDDVKKRRSSAQYSDDYIIVISEKSDLETLTNLDSNHSHDLTEYHLADDDSTEPEVEARAAIEQDTYILNSDENIEHIIEEDGKNEDSDAQIQVQTKKSLNVDSKEKNLVTKHIVDSVEVCGPKKADNHSYRCKECGNIFTTHTALKSHVRTHGNVKSFTCELCSKTFTAACNLTTHMRIHTGEKPYKCNYCGRRFTDRSTHRKHERVHTNERPFACKVCGKSFSLSTSLKAHEAVHSKEKPYMCLTCNKGFKLPHQLKAHENTHVHRYEVGMLFYNEEDDLVD